METLAKLELTTPLTLFEQADTDRSPLQLNPAGVTRTQYCRRFGEKSEQVSVDGRTLPIYHSALPGGRRAPLLKAMITTTCDRRCHYCAFHPSTNIPRISFHAEEMASVFMQLYRLERVHGLFLSSGINSSGADAQNLILDTAEILRNRYAFRGYLHLKIMPGAESGQVLRAMQLATRLSINLEAPNARRLKKLAPAKRFQDELLRPLQWIEHFRSVEDPSRAALQRWPTSATQFVVGAGGESDLEILQVSTSLFSHLHLSRIYYEAFSPQPGTPFQSLPAERPEREHHLYQASMLLQHYQYSVEDLPFDQQGNLPQNVDPKLAAAQVTLAQQPVELNQAPLENLLRVPGIGPGGARAILSARRIRTLKDLSQLTRLGILPSRAAPFILLDGKRPSYQLQLFPVNT